MKFCTGRTNSLFPCELWRGKATLTSTLEAVSVTSIDGVSCALQWCIQGRDDGHEPVSERTIRRWTKRASSRVPVATAILGVPHAAGNRAGGLEDLLSVARLTDLLAVRQRWGVSLLDVPPPVKPATCAMCLKPGFQNPLPPQNPPSRYLRRGTRSCLARRGRPPDD